MRKLFVARTMLALFTVLALSASHAFAQTVNIVTRSGERYRTQMIDMGARSEFSVWTNGRELRIPVDEVAMIDFTGNGSMSQNEQNRAADQGEGGLVVLRNGQTIPGRLTGLQPQSNLAIVNRRAGDRTVPLNQVARVYLQGGYGQSSNGSWGGFGGDSRNGNGDNGYSAYDNNGGSYGRRQYGNRRGLIRQLTVPSDQQWTDSGIDVSRGQTLRFRATGSIQLSGNEADVASAAGATSGRKAGNSPVPSMTGGALVGRIDNGQAFVVGSDRDIAMPAGGRLYLGINDDVVNDNTGSFDVQISRQ